MTRIHTVTVAAILFGLSALSGCYVDPYPHGSGNPPPNLSSIIQYPILSRAGITTFDIGYYVTANTGGSYRVVWTDPGNSAAYFHGSIYSDGGFTQYGQYVDPVDGASLAYLTLVSTNRLDFDSRPGAYHDGVDLVSSTPNLYLDVYIDGIGAANNIFFVDPTGATVASPVNPVGFTM
jgi:hypothetical protein